MIKLADAGIFLILALIAGFGCDRSPAKRVELPAIPPAETSGLEPAVREQISAARRAVDSDPGSPEANGALGATYHAYGWLEPAKVCYRRATLLEPGTFRWWYCLGRVLVETGQTKEGIDAVRRAASLKDDYVPAALFLGGLALNDGDLEEARRWSGLAFKISPRSPHALNALGQIASREGKTEEAIRRYREALELAPRFGSACYGLAIAYRAAGDLENAGRFLGRYSSCDKFYLPPDPILEDVQALRRDADHVLRAASGLMEKKDYAAAVRRYEEVLRLNPELSMAEYNIGLALQLMKDPTKAVEHYQAFLRRRPDSIDALNNVGLCLYDTDRSCEAMEYFQRAVAIDPTYAKGHFNLGLASIKAGKPAEAVGHFQKSLSIRPRDAEAHWNLGLVLKQDGKREEARAHFFQVLEIRPDDERAQGQLLGEIKIQLDASAKDRSRPEEARRGLADLLRRKGLYRAAVSVLERGLRGEGSDGPIAIELAWLLATCPDASLRKPEEAVRLLDPLCRQGAREDPRALDALACAHAAAGRFEEAIRAAETALRLAEARNGSSVMAQLAGGIRARLKLFEEKKPYLEH